MFSFDDVMSLSRKLLEIIRKLFGNVTFLSKSLRNVQVLVKPEKCRESVVT